MTRPKTETRTRIGCLPNANCEMMAQQIAEMHELLIGNLSEPFALGLRGAVEHHERLIRGCVRSILYIVGGAALAFVTVLVDVHVRAGVDNPPVHMVTAKDSTSKMIPAHP